MALPLGRLTPPDFDHVVLWAAGLPTVGQVEQVLRLPHWHWTHDQGHEGSCVGHGSVMERAITNTSQNRLARLLRPTRRYDPISLWNDAKEVDGDPSTNPGDDNGTYVRAAYDVLRDKGARRVHAMHLESGVPNPVGLRDYDYDAGATVNRWAQSTDEIRTSISQQTPVTIGINWYTAFDKPVAGADGEYWIAKDTTLGGVRGGHCVCVYGASDARQAVKIKNSWGKAYPLVWLPYSVLQTLLSEDGEATLVTDR